MNSSRTIEGSWSILGNEEPCFGVLEYLPDSGAILTVNLPFTGDFSQRAKRLFEKDDPVPKIIHGLDANGHPITLFGCTAPSKKHSGALVRIQVHPLYTFLGKHLDSWDHLAFQEAFVEYSAPSSWLCRTGIKTEFAPNWDSNTSYQRPPDIKCRLNGGVKLAISVRPTCKGEYNSYQISERQVAEFEFPSPEHFERINRNWIHVFRRFLGLMTGIEVFLDKASFRLPESEPQDEIEVLRTNEHVDTANRSLLAGNSLVEFAQIRDSLEAVLQRWFSYHEHLDAVLDLYFATIFNRGFHGNHFFLFMAQALEVYHAHNPRFNGCEEPKAAFKTRRNRILGAVTLRADKDWLKEKLHFANSKTLARRIKDILDLHPDDIANLIPHPEAFAAKIRHTRNYLTHYDKKLRESGKIAEGLELHRMCYQMKALLEICMLKDIGIDGSPIERVINRVNAMRFYGVDD